VIYYGFVFLWAWTNYFFTFFIKKERVFFDFVALLVFVIFAGLRYKTGNDWLVYQMAFESMPGDLTFDFFSESSFEPLYLLSAILIREVSDFQGLMFAVSLLNGVVLFFLCRFFNVSFAGVFAIYFAWIYLSIQMAAMRYSIAISFLLMATIFWFKGYGVRWVACVGAAIGFHIFSLVFLLFFLISNFKFKIWIFHGAVVCSFIFGLSFNWLYNYGLFSWVPFYEKLELYILSTAYDSLSIGSFIYIVVNYLFMVFLLHDRQESKFLNLVKWATLFIIVFQVGLWFLPVFWIRVQAFVLIIQACYISKYLLDKRSLVFGVFVFFISFVVFLKPFFDPAMVSYFPYQNLILYEVFGVDDEDGDLRFYKSLGIHEERNLR